MPCPVLALLLRSSLTTVFADDVQALACHLTPTLCAVVVHEVAVDAELFALGQEIVGLGLSRRTGPRR